MIGQNQPEADRLRSFIERIERLEEEKRALADDIKEVYSAKGSGYDPKIMRKVIQMRKQDLDQRKEEEALLDSAPALGMPADTPLGQAAFEYGE